MKDWTAVVAAAAGMRGTLYLVGRLLPWAPKTERLFCLPGWLYVLVSSYVAELSVITHALYPPASTASCGLRD